MCTYGTEFEKCNNFSVNPCSRYYVTAIFLKFKTKLAYIST